MLLRTCFVLVFAALFLSNVDANSDLHGKIKVRNRNLFKKKIQVEKRNVNLDTDQKVSLWTKTKGMVKKVWVMSATPAMVDLVRSLSKKFLKNLECHIRVDCDCPEKKVDKIAKKMHKRHRRETILKAAFAVIEGKLSKTNLKNALNPVKSVFEGKDWKEILEFKQVNNVIRMQEAIRII